MNTVFSHLFGEAPPVEDFSNSYRCYSFDMHEGSDQARDTLRQGGHVLLPQSALRDMSVASASGSGPMIFNVSYNGHSALVGVHEFTAPEGVVLVPDWLLRRLGLHDSSGGSGEGSIVQVSALPPDRRPPLGTFARLRPWSGRPEFGDFLAEVDDPKAVLENRLRDFICLSIGDEIDLKLNGRRYRLSVVDVRPASSVCIVDCDLAVEFDVSRTPSDESSDEVESLVNAEQGTEHSEGSISGSTVSTVDIRRDGSTATGATAVHERGRPNFNYNWGTLNYPQHRRLLAPAAATDAEQKQQQQQLSKGFVAFSGSGQSLGGNLASTTTSTTNGSISRSRLIRNCEINMGSEFSKITDY
ncbi:hypothetical protein BOX15_Mlig008122g1 [Macrostomum lignano]|uniref:UFD1 domain-containing protein n=1 Tax=Macrostomum lignano TaxID=282301 RepID=A0A267E547_9PLAT|nr:hypothetical protein BOX15_Mlig008122g1 [Macrostomum lignano]